MLQVLIAVLVLVATAIQAWSSAVELGRANRDAIDWWDAEDALVAEQRRRYRRRTRRLLVEERDKDLHREIRRVKWTLGSWVALMAAASASLVDQLL